MRSKLRKTACFAVTAALFCTYITSTGSVFAQEAEKALPSGLTVSEFETQAEKLVNESKQPDAAVAVAVVSGEETLTELSFGYSDIENKINADENSVYEWGSLTKTLTWISVMQLEEQGKIVLTEDISKYLPEGYLKKLKFDTHITMLDLMNHTGGWQDSITNVYTSHENEVLPLWEFCSKYEPSQLYEPGTTVAYSNWGVALAGYIVECVSGESYINYVNNHIFKPLGMMRTSIDPLRSDCEFVKEALSSVKGYTTSGDEISGFYYAPDYPAAGAAGTLGDAELFMKALLTNNGEKLFKKSDTLLRLFTPTNDFLNTGHDENAHGFWFDFYGAKSLGHYGNTAQFSTHMSIDPVSNCGILVMTNIAQETEFNVGMGNFVFGEAKTNTENSDNWMEHSFKQYYTSARTIENGYCNIYSYFMVYSVKVEDTTHITISSPFMSLPCTRIDEDVYLVSSGMLKGYTIYVDADEDGLVKRLAASTFDFVEHSSVDVVFDNASFIALAVGLLAALFSLVWSIVEIIRKKDRSIFVRIAMNLFTIGYFAVAVLEIMTLMATTASTSDIIPMVVYYGAHVVLSVAYAAWFFIRRRKNPATIATLFSSVAVSGFILYWQMLAIM